MKPLRVFRALLLITVVAGSAYQLLSLVAVASFKGRQSSRDKRANSRTKWPLVSILKPVCGSDEQLRENLISYCVQDYPDYEVLIGVADRDDRALPVAEEVVRSFPLLARIVVGDAASGMNRKVANLAGLERMSQSDLLAVSDSDMRVEPHYLKTIVDEYLRDPRAGLVTCPYAISQADSVGTRCESLTITSDFLPAVLVARCLEGMGFGLGASLLVSKPILREIGGFQGLRDYLADDYQMGHRIREKGYEVILSRYVMNCVVGSISVGDYIKHQLRWAVTYRISRPKGYLAYGITHLLPLTVVFSLLKGRHTRWIPAGALLLRIALTQLTSAKLTGRQSPYKPLMLLPLKDFLGLGIWLISFFTRTVSWRGRRYRILKDGTMKELEPADCATP